MRAWSVVVVAYPDLPLRKWWQRYQKDGVDGLVSQSRRPKSSPSTKVGETEDHLICTSSDLI